jgi:hypothetical protein
VAAGLAVLSGCVVGPKYHPPAPPTAGAATYKETLANFKDAQGWKVANPQEGMLRGKWWEIFNDPDLNSLEDRLEINNQNIKQYFQNFMEARAVVAEARSLYWSTVLGIAKSLPERWPTQLWPMPGRPPRSSPFLSTFPGRRISGARFVIRYGRSNMPRKSAPPTWKWSGLPRKLVSRNTTSKFAARML